MSKTYTIQAECNNCGHYQPAVIECGITVISALKSRGCERCECDEMIKRESQDYQTITYSDSTWYTCDCGAGCLGKCPALQNTLSSNVDVRQETSVVVVRV